MLWPDGPGVPSEDPNLRAVVCLVSYGETDVLLGADAESPVLLPLRLPPVEVLKVPITARRMHCYRRCWRRSARAWL